MIDSLLAYIAPHLCYGCGQIGTLMCDSCKDHIDTEEMGRCLVCERATHRYLCHGHGEVIDRGWYGAMRTGIIEQLIDAYKFENVKAAAMPLAEVLLEQLPSLPVQTVLVPVPTIPKHIRQRGYDHTLLIAQIIARRRRLTLAPLLQRKTTTSQRDANRRLREKQAQEAFAVTAQLDPEKVYLIIDDVATTGATLRHAARVLHQAGAQTVWVAAVARQPLD